MTTVTSKDNSLDSVLIQLGEFGKYQIFVFSLVCFAVVLHSAVHVAFVFTAMDLEYRCQIPNCEGTSNSFDNDWIRNAVPFEDDKPSKCSRFKPLNNSTSCLKSDFDQKNTEHCSNFVFKTDEESILQEYGLYCEENLWKLTLVGTINSVGQFFGLFISGILSDRYGRKQVLVWGMVLCAISGIIRSFMPSYELFLVFEFLDAAFGAGTYICGFVLGVELVGPKKRVLTGTISSSCYALGEIFVAGSAWLLHSWKPLIYVLYTPPFLLLSYIWIVPESVRWLLSKGRNEEAKAILRTAAKVNGKHLSEDSLEKLVVEEEVPVIANPLKEMVKSSILMIRLVNCCFCWITCAFLFYGLTLNSIALAGNGYLDFILSAIVEIPAYFICTYIIDKFGRKISLSGSYLLTGAACVGFIFIPSDIEWASLTIYLVGKFGATVSFTVLYVLTSEIFPTGMRHSLMGICSTFGRIGSMIAPQTPLLAQIWTPMPLVMFGGMSVLAGLITLIFPETNRIKLPDTVEEAENIGKANKDNKL